MSNIEKQKSQEYLLLLTNCDLEPQNIFEDDCWFELEFIQSYLADNTLKNEIEVSGEKNGIIDYRNATGQSITYGNSTQVIVLKIPSNIFQSANGETAKPIITKINYGPKGNIHSIAITKKLIHGVLLPNGEYINNPNYTPDYDPKGMLPMPVLELQKGRKQSH